MVQKINWGIAVGKKKEGTRGAEEIRDKERHKRWKKGEIERKVRVEQIRENGQ
jgi:hypothetical protein